MRVDRSPPTMMVILLGGELSWLSPPYLRLCIRYSLARTIATSGICLRGPRPRPTKKRKRRRRRRKPRTRKKVVGWVVLGEVRLLAGYEVQNFTPLTHGVPGTPVGDLFPLGNLVFVDGWENWGRNPAMEKRIFRPLHQDGWGPFLHVRQGDSEAMAASFTYELEESTAAAAQQGQLRN